MSEFLPAGYEKPASGSKYLKLQQGANKFRILSDAMVGWIDWDKTGEKPVPVRTKEQPKKALNPMQGYKHFWTFIVFDYRDNSLKIMEITQSGIQDSILALYNDEAWGSPKNYDLSITREGENLETRYTVMPCPPTPVRKEILDLYVATPINLEALWTNDDPFDTTSPKRNNVPEITDNSFPEEPINVASIPF